MAEFSTSMRADDKKDYIELGKPIAASIMRDKIAVTEKRATFERRPFCRACAWGAFRLGMAVRKQELEGETGVAFPEEHPEFNKVAERINPEDFFGGKYFDKLSENPVYIQKTLPTGKKESIIGEYHVEYQCKHNKTHHCTVCIPVEDYETWKLGE